MKSLFAVVRLRLHAMVDCRFCIRLLLSLEVLGAKPLHRCAETKSSRFFTLHPKHNTPQQIEQWQSHNLLMLYTILMKSSTHHSDCCCHHSVHVAQ